jgi:hypothetical protein
MMKSKNGSQMSKSTPALTTKKEVAVHARESSWDSSPQYQIPKYDAELDANCPRASVRHYNKTKKLNAIASSKKGKGASDWIENTIKKKFDDIPIREKQSLRDKALAAAVREESVTEVDILQKIIVRENLLLELDKLLKFQVDLDGIISEAVEIIKAIRFQTLEIVEEVYAWKNDFKAPRQFYFRGENYLLKMMKDTAFLDEFDDLGDYFGFYFAGNPLMYSGIPTDDGGRSLASTFSAKEIDGISERRLYAAENIVLQEQEKYGKQAAARGRNGMEPEDTVERGAVLAQDGSQYHLVHVGEDNMAGESVLDVNSSHDMTADQRRNSAAASRGVPVTAGTRGSESAGRVRAKRADKRRNDDGSVKSVKVPSELR